MRIGLLSPHYAFNYGAVLQAFALKKYLTTQGYEPVILNRRPAYQCAIPSLAGRIARRLEELAKRNSFGKFERNYLQPQTSPIIFQEDWSQFPSFHLDAVIVGSDQVWRDNYVFHAFGYNLFLDFVSGDTKRIAYAPSLGKESWNADPEVEAKVKMLLDKFDGISVREESSVKILKDKFDVEAQLVVDPTLLLKAEDYLQSFDLRPDKKNYIAAYMLDYNDRFARNLMTLSNHFSMPLRTIGVKTPSSSWGIMLNRFKPMASVTKWVANIAHSTFVVTNSFHGAVFSIIFRKQFIVVMNNERGAARFLSLLKMFGLENRLVDETVTDYSEILKQPIDYAQVASKIQAWREESENYLKRNLQS